MGTVTAPLPLPPMLFSVVALAILQQAGDPQQHWVRRLHLTGVAFNESPMSSSQNIVQELACTTSP